MAFTEREKAGIFFGPLETINALFPFFLLAVGVAESMLWKSAYDPLMRINDFVVRIIFLEFIHALITYTAIVRLPEFKEFLSDKYDRISKFWIPVIAVNLVSFFMLCSTVLVPFRLPLVFGIPLALIGLAAPLLHSVGQTFGLSMLYNENATDRLKSHELDAALSVARKERWLSRALLLFLIFVALLKALLASASIDIKQQASYFRVLEAGVILFIVAAILWVSRAYPTFRASNKSLFLARYSVYFLMPFSAIAQYGLSALHGTEYLFLFSSVLKNSRATREEKRRFWRLIALFVPLYVAGAFFCATGPGALYFGSYEKIPFLLRCIGIIPLTLGFGHYYIDGILFRFSDPLVRRHLLPLYLNPTLTRSSPAPQG